MKKLFVAITIIGLAVIARAGDGCCQMKNKAECPMMGKTACCAKDKAACPVMDKPACTDTNNVSDSAKSPEGKPQPSLKVVGETGT